MSFDLHSRSHLTRHDVARFPDATLLHRIARTVCSAECLPRKELFESWEVARRTNRRFKGGRVVDLACGHALTAWILLILDPTSEAALAVDRTLPPSAERLAAVLSDAFPKAAARMSRRAGDLTQVPLHASDLVVATHACGALTDVVLARACEVRARVAVLPCCHDVETCDTGGLLGWLEPALAIDATRALRLRAAGYHVHTATIPSAITPMNRLLLGAPRDLS